jgi:hypothetical protein
MSFSNYDFSESIRGEGIERESIKRVLAAHGVTEASCCESCGGEWSGGFLLEMKDGRFAYVTGWCDYTGWGCRDGTTVTWFDHEPDTTSLQAIGEVEWETVLPDLQRYIETGEGGLE